MSFIKAASQGSSKTCQNLTTGYDLPLKTTVIVNPRYQDDLAVKANQEMPVISQYDGRLHMDGLCQNTIDNLNNSSTTDEEKIERAQWRLSCSVLLMFIVCIVSLISLVLTLLMLTGNVSSRCSCASTKDRIFRGEENSEFRGKENSDLVGRWLLVLRNMTEKLDVQSRDFQKLKDDFISLNQKKGEKDKRLQESLVVTKKELDSKISTMETKVTSVDVYLTKLNVTAQEINKTIDKLRQDLGDAKKDLRLKFESMKKTFESSVTRLSNKIDLLEINISRSQVDSKVNKLQTSLNKTAEEFYKVSNNIQQNMMTFNKDAHYKINNTKRALDASRTILYSHIKDLKESLLMIKNMTEVCRGNNGSRGLAEVPGRPSSHTNIANFSHCQYKYKFSAAADTNSTSLISIEVDLKELKGKRIVGSTCSTNGAGEYNFKRLKINGENVYRCTCKGKSELFKTTGHRINCYIHYWECPLSI